MKSLLDNFAKRFNIKRRIASRRFVIFTFFLFLSIIFWLLNALSKQYTSEIYYPINYSNLPEDKILIGREKLPTKLLLSISGYGFTILQHNIKLSETHAEIDFSTLSNITSAQQDSLRYFVLSKSVQEQIEKKLSSGLNIEAIYPDSLIFQFARAIEKKVRVIPNYKCVLGKQFMLKTPVYVTPDSVFIKGPHLILDTISEIETNPVILSGIETFTQVSTALTKLKDIEIPQEKVTINAPVEEYTEARIKVPIEIANVPENVMITLFPCDANLTFLVALSDYTIINSADFKVSVDYSSIKTQKNYLVDKLKVKIITLPKYARNLDAHPRKVEYIIEKK